jgi:hypothetical protein
MKSVRNLTFQGFRPYPEDRGYRMLQNGEFIPDYMVSCPKG